MFITCAAMVLGTEEHKNLFCRFFIYTHKVYKPADISWPDLNPEIVEKLSNLPIWSYAIHTEQQVARKLTAYSEQVDDSLLREALALQGYEEGRHADILKYFLNRYQIRFEEVPADPLPPNLEWAFMRTGAGECIDAFFGFGFLKLAQTSGEYPPELIRALEPVVEEEARHLLFFQNWLFYERYRRPLPYQSLHYLRSVWAFACALGARLRTLHSPTGEAFALRATRYLASSISIRSFLDTCLRENKRLLAPYDRRLPRPKLIPTLVGLARIFFENPATHQ